MEAVLQSLTQHASIAILVVVAIACVALGVAVFATMRLRKLQAQWQDLLKDSRGESLEKILFQHLSDRREQEKRNTVSDQRIAKLEELMKSSKRFVGLVRFDAFEDVAGSQSFALAIYDDRGDGAIVSSIVGRSSCRVYCKPLIAGRSERDLSPEEQRAIHAAIDEGPRLIVSP